jgi:hypothetical protein
VNLWTQQAAVWAIGPIPILASVNALACSYRCPFQWAVHRLLGDRQAMSRPTDLDAFLTVGKLTLHVAWLDWWVTCARVQDFHAMERRSVQQGPPRFTRDPAELGIRLGRVTSVHQSSPRTVTSLVTSRVRCRACPETRSRFRTKMRYQHDDGQCTLAAAGRTAGAHAAGIRPCFILPDPGSSGRTPLRATTRTGSRAGRSDRHARRLG